MFTGAVNAVNWRVAVDFGTRTYSIRMQQMLGRFCMIRICSTSRNYCWRYALKCIFMILKVLLKSKVNISLCTYLIFIDHSFIC